MIPLYGSVQAPYEYSQRARAQTVGVPGDPATQSPSHPAAVASATSSKTAFDEHSFDPAHSTSPTPPWRGFLTPRLLPSPRPRVRNTSAQHDGAQPATTLHRRTFSLPFPSRKSTSNDATVPKQSLDALRAREAQRASQHRRTYTADIRPEGEQQQQQQLRRRRPNDLDLGAPQPSAVSRGPGGPLTPISPSATVATTATAEHEMDGNTPAELAARLASSEDTVRKLAAFKLKDAIGDPSFADVFALEGGVNVLRTLCMNSSANTLAYSLTSFSNLLEIDKGWESVDKEFVQKVVALVIKEPLVNILRGALSILVAIVQRSGSQTLLDELNAPDPDRVNSPGERYRLFLEMLVSRLSSADHALCANAMQLINSLMRDAITNGDSKWPQFVKQLQDLGVIRAVYALMQSTALQDLAQPLLEFQTLTKILLRKWRDVPVDMKRTEQQKAMKGIQAAAGRALEREVADEIKHGYEPRTVARSDVWQRLGFEDDNKLEPEFDEVGFLGMMDAADYVRKTEDGFEKLVLEQGMQQPETRCPIARASIAVTSILYDHFDIDKPDLDDVKEYLALDSRNGVDRLYKPMLLQWSRLHTAGLQSFLRLWKATGAQVGDFDKVTELVRILMDAVVGAAGRTKEIGAIEEEIASYDCQTLRELQMELVELAYEDSWGEHLKQVREELHHEALLFIKEQRVRCMLAGAWFPKRADTESTANGVNGDITTEQRGRANWRYARLSHNRRYLHYADFEFRPPTGAADPTLDELVEKIDLHTVSSVISNVVPLSSSPASSTTTLQATQKPSVTPTSRIVINTLTSSSPTASPKGAIAATQAHHAKSNSDASNSTQRQEAPLLTLYPSTPSLASEWLDGLLLLLDQAPITDETKKLLSTVGSWGLKIRLLNVSFDDAGTYGEDGQVSLDGSNGAGRGDGTSGLPRVPGGRGVVPSREGLDEDYYYDVFGGV